jgi:hypothetical protein
MASMKMFFMKGRSLLGKKVIGTAVVVPDMNR